MSGETYMCARCGKTFISDWTEAEAQAEAEQLWGRRNPSYFAVVCDDCFKDIPKPQ